MRRGRDVTGEADGTNRTKQWLQQGIGLRFQIVERQAYDGNGQERQSHELANLQTR